jgi:hypothetical protein
MRLRVSYSSEYLNLYIERTVNLKTGRICELGSYDAAEIL